VVTRSLAISTGDQPAGKYNAKNVAKGVAYPFQKRPKLCTRNRVNVFVKGYNAAGPFRGEPSSDHVVPTAAMYSVKRARLAGYTVTAVSNMEVHQSGFNTQTVGETQFLVCLLQLFIVFLLRLLPYGP
jgi:hypothetical protein